MAIVLFLTLLFECPSLLFLGSCTSIMQYTFTWYYLLINSYRKKNHNNFYIFINKIHATKCTYTRIKSDYLHTLQIFINDNIQITRRIYTSMKSFYLHTSYFCCFFFTLSLPTSPIGDLVPLFHPVWVPHLQICHSVDSSFDFYDSDLGYLWNVIDNKYWKRKSLGNFEYTHGNMPLLRLS